MTVGGINNYLGAMNSMNGVAPASPVFDYKAAQQQAQATVDSFRNNNKQVQLLKEDAADFLKQYTNEMNDLNKTASNLTGGNLDKLLFDKDGKVTDKTVKDTTDAVQKMVDSYNDSLKMLNKNASRGTGVTNQIGRMADNPTSLEGMKMVGVSVNKDGTLALDKTKMAEALKTETPGQQKLVRDIIGGSSGLAAGVEKDARAGLRTPAGNLINNDLATMQSIKKDDPLRNLAMYSRNGGAFGMNNMMAAGALLNMMV